ncbi:WD40 repeat domain-containing protein, partial [Salmonella sp. s51228]|uniref:WD40 repeat domain-containing protein n=1 Tax=Salmonella sp. s51228 TaxID=3159652 RepID=UPI003980126C
SWSDDSKRIAVCGAGSEKYVHAFMFDSGSSVGIMAGPAKTCNSVSFKQSRPYRVIVGSEDFSSYFFAGPPFKLQSSIRDHTNFVNVVRYSPDGSNFVTGSSDGRVLLYEGKESVLKGCFGGEKTHDMGATSVCWSAN